MEAETEAAHADAAEAASLLFKGSFQNCKLGQFHQITGNMEGFSQILFPSLPCKNKLEGGECQNDELDFLAIYQRSFKHSHME